MKKVTFSLLMAVMFVFLCNNGSVKADSWKQEQVDEITSYGPGYLEGETVYVAKWVYMDKLEDKTGYKRQLSCNEPCITLRMTKYQRVEKDGKLTWKRVKTSSTGYRSSIVFFVDPSSLNDALKKAGVLNEKGLTKKGYDAETLMNATGYRFDGARWVDGEKTPVYLVKISDLPKKTDVIKVKEKVKRVWGSLQEAQDDWEKNNYLTWSYSTLVSYDGKTIVKEIRTVEDPGHQWYVDSSFEERYAEKDHRMYVLVKVMQNKEGWSVVDDILKDFGNNLQWLVEVNGFIHYTYTEEELKRFGDPHESEITFFMRRFNSPVNEFGNIYLIQDGSEIKYYDCVFQCAEVTFDGEIQDVSKTVTVLDKNGKKKKTFTFETREYDGEFEMINDDYFKIPPIIKIN